MYSEYFDTTISISSRIKLRSNIAEYFKALDTDWPVLTIKKLQRLASPSTTYLVTQLSSILAKDTKLNDTSIEQYNLLNTVHYTRVCYHQSLAQLLLDAVDITSKKDKLYEIKDDGKEYIEYILGTLQPYLINDFIEYGLFRYFKLHINTHKFSNLTPKQVSLLQFKTLYFGYVECVRKQLCFL